MLGNLSSHSDLLPGMGGKKRVDGRTFFRAFLITHLRTHTHTLNRRAHEHAPPLSTQESVKVISLLSPLYYNMHMRGLLCNPFPVSPPMFPSLSVLSCLFHALRTSWLIASLCTDTAQSGVRFSSPHLLLVALHLRAPHPHPMYTGRHYRSSDS